MLDKIHIAMMNLGLQSNSLLELEINSKVMIMLLEIAILNSNSYVDLPMSNNANMCTKKTKYILQNKKIHQITLVMLLNQLRKTL